jgi:transcriptional regulator with XRE-family HTH domain
MSISIQPTDIKDLRIRLRMKQKEFAEILGVKLRSIQNYESGETRPRGETFDKILRLMEDNPEGGGVVFDKQSIIRHIAENREDYLSDPVFMSVVGLMEVGKLRDENAEIRESLLELTNRYQELAKTLKVGQ